jgi:hypothetical protein
VEICSSSESVLEEIEEKDEIDSLESSMKFELSVSLLLLLELSELAHPHRFFF